jgi:hypothetical protein
MTKSTRKTSETVDKNRPSPESDDDHDLEDEIEDEVEELAATFGAGPKAAPVPEGPMEGEQYAP